MDLASMCGYKTQYIMNKMARLHPTIKTSDGKVSSVITNR